MACFGVLAVGAILLIVFCFYRMVEDFQDGALLLGFANLVIALIFIVFTVAFVGIGIQVGLYFFLP